MAASYTAAGFRVSRRASHPASVPLSRFHIRRKSPIVILLPGLAGCPERVLDRHAELAHLLLEILSVHPDVLGRLADVAAVAAEGVEQEVALERRDHPILGFLERGRRLPRRGRRRWSRSGRAREDVLGGDLGSRREQERLFDRGAQLAHVALPRVRDTGP